MALFLDARIPVVFGVPPGEGDAVLVGQADWATPHAADCACCVARGPAARALDHLFLDRVRGRVPWFNRVVVTGAEDPVRTAVMEDGVVMSRYRLG
jgi:hypothetical protein